LSNSTAFKVEFGSSTRIKTTKKPKEGKSDEKKKRRLTTTKDNSETHFPFTVGLGNVPMGTIEAERESAELNGDGMTMQGFFTFPLMKKFGVVKKPIIDVLEIAGKDFDMKKVSFKRGDGKAFTTFNAAGKYKLVVKSLEIHENFRGFGLGGLMFTDKKNHFIVNSFNVIKYKSLKYPVPGMEMSFTKAGYRVKDLRLKSPEDQTIKFGYNKGDAAYEVDGGLIMELQKGKGGSLAKKLFPLTAQRFIISTSGKFFVALKADLKLKIGPITINAKKILFNKGASMTWAEMTTYLTKSQKEIDKFSKTSKFNNANAKAIGTDKNKGKRDSKMAAVNAMEVSYDNPEPELDEEDVKWAFGFSGGIQFASIKGMGAKVDAGFLLGDKGKGFEIQFNEIDILVESTAFKASATVKIVNTPEKTGMEGVAELVTVKKRFKAKLKFYKLQGGIEFGVGFVGAAMIPLGAPPAGPIIICSALGGEVDFNTKDHKFMVRLEGAAFAPGTVPEVSEFRNIALQVEFNGKKCGVWPVITGTTDWYLKGEKWCGAKIVLDFCKQSVLLDVECRQEIIKGAMAQIKATIFCSIPNKSIFMGASIRTELFMLKLNGSLQLGVNNNFSLSPPDVKHYKGFLPDFMLNKGTTLNGIYVGVETTAKASSSGKVGIWKFSAAYSADAYAKAKFQLGYNFTTTNFVAEALVKGGIKAKLSVSKYSLNGNGKLLLTLKGGYNNSLSWHCNGKALVDMSVYNSGGNSLRCNSAKVNWKSREQTYPCGLKCCCGRWSWPRKPRCRTKYCSKSISYPSGFAFKGCFKFDKSFKYQSK